MYCTGVWLKCLNSLKNAFCLANPRAHNCTTLLVLKLLSYYLLAFAVVGGVVFMAAMAGIICCILYKKYKRRKNKGKISITMEVLYSLEWLFFVCLFIFLGNHSNLTQNCYSKRYTKLCCYYMCYKLWSTNPHVPLERSGKGPCKLSCMCWVYIDHVVACHCWQWHYRVGEQSWYGVTTGKSCKARAVA